MHKWLPPPVLPVQQVPQALMVRLVLPARLVLPDQPVLPAPPARPVPLALLVRPAPLAPLALRGGSRQLRR